MRALIDDINDRFHGMPRTYRGEAGIYMQSIGDTALYYSKKSKFIALATIFPCRGKVTFFRGPRKKIAGSGISQEYLLGITASRL